MTDLAALLRDIADEITGNGVKLEREVDAKDPGAEPRPFGIAVATIDGAVVRAGCGGAHVVVHQRVGTRSGGAGVVNEPRPERDGERVGQCSPDRGR